MNRCVGGVIEARTSAKGGAACARLWRAVRRLKIRLFGSGPRSPVALDGRPALDLAWPRLATPGPTTECRHHRHRCTHRPSRSVSAAVPAA